jgi:hypothetical protein
MLRAYVASCRQPPAAGSQPMPILLSIQFAWNGVPAMIRRQIRAVLDPRSGTKVPKTGIAATIRVPCDWE